MSAGAFTRSRYQASYDNDMIHPIRVQPETEDAASNLVFNQPPSGSANSPISARVSGGKRTLGLTARRIILEAPSSGQPSGYLAKGITSIPALNIAFYNAATKGSVCTYLGVEFNVVGRSPEYVN